MSPLQAQPQCAVFAPVGEAKPRTGYPNRRISWLNAQFEHGVDMRESARATVRILSQRLLATTEGPAVKLPGELNQPNLRTGFPPGLTRQKVLPVART